MLNKFSGFVLAAAVVAAPATLSAQTDTVVYGRTTIALSSAFTQQLSSLGVTIDDLSGNPLPNGSLTLTAVNGVFDLQTALGDVLYAGGLRVSAQGQTLRVQALEFSISNATTAIISGDFVVNGKFIGREDIFFVNQNPVGTVYTLPVALQNSTVTLNGFSLGLSPSFVSLVNNALGQQALTPGVQVGTANIFDVFDPSIGN